MDKNVDDETAFVAHNWLLVYSNVPFDLRNALARLQITVNVRMTTVKRQYGLVNIVAIIILLNTPAGRLLHIEKVLKLLSNARMTIGLRKCSFPSKTINQFKNTIAPDELHAATKRNKAIKALQYQTAA